MQINDPIVVGVILGALGGVGKWIQAWMARVDAKLESLTVQPEKCRDSYVTKEECEKCYKGVWKAVNKLEERLHEHEMRQA